MTSFKTTNDFEARALHDQGTHVCIPIFTVRNHESLQMSCANSGKMQIPNFIVCRDNANLSSNMGNLSFLSTYLCISLTIVIFISL